MAGYYRWTPYEFDEENDFKVCKLWVWDKKESYATSTPFEVALCEIFYCLTGFTYAAERICLPTTKGIDYRTKDSWFFISVMIPSKEEQKKREVIFRERIAPWIEDFSKEWGKLRDELMGYYERFKVIDVEKLSDIDLRQHLRDWIPVYHKNAEYHFIAMYAGTCIYMLFEDMCKELLGIDRHDPLFGKLMGGFDNRVFQTDRGLWELGERAKKLGLEPIFNATPNDDELLSKLEKSEPGRKWLKELHDFLWTDGWRTQANWFVSVPSWVEKPILAVPKIRLTMGAGEVFILDREQERLKRERQKAEKEVLARIPADKKEWFSKLMRGAQLGNSWNEDHQFYCENYACGMWRRITKEIGNRFAQAEMIDEPQDIYYLFLEEIDMRFVNRPDAHKLVRIRKEQHKEFRKVEPPLFIGDTSLIPQLLTADPVLVTRIVAEPRVKPGLKADLFGAASTPGVVEGVARFIMSEAEFGQVQPGEILITVETNPIWTPLFGIVKAVVTDVGGTLSHAIIVGREYGLPVVCGTQEGTKKIKTGMKIRVDGDMCAVYILD